MTQSRRLLKQALLVTSALSVFISAQARADELVVCAAASLTNAFKAVSDAFGDQVVQLSDSCVRENQAFAGYARSGS